MIHIHIFHLLLQMVANAMACDPSSNEELVKCMRQKTADDYVTAMKKVRLFILKMK